MPSMKSQTVNQFGFFLLGLTNHFNYAIMMAAAYDLLSPASENQPAAPGGRSVNYFCHKHSTSTIGIANSVPALVIKIIFPFLLIDLPDSLKVFTAVALGSMAYTITSLVDGYVLIFLAVTCATSSGAVGENTFLTMAPFYGKRAINGWSIGTGFAGLLSTLSYALLRMLLPVNQVLLTMLVIPALMTIAYLYMIKVFPENTSATDLKQFEHPADELKNEPSQEPFDLKAKLRHIPNLCQYCFPLLILFFAEYFINGGLMELIYYPEVTYLDHASQYRWFQVCWALGSLLGRSSLDLFTLNNIWLMSGLQVTNALLLLAHTSMLLRIPNFYLTAVIFTYEGTLGGLTYANAFRRIQTEMPVKVRKFSTSFALVADAVGTVTAYFVALSAREQLCKLYR